MSNDIRIPSGRARRWRVSRVVLLTLLFGAGLLASPAAAQDQLVHHADFNADATGVPLPTSFDPVAVPDVAGDQIVLTNPELNGNQIRVQAAPGGGFPTKSLRIANPQGFGNFPLAEFRPAPALGPYNSGFYTVTWSSSVEQSSRFSMVALVSPAGSSAFTVNYTRDAGNAPRIAFQSGAGVTLTSIPYVVNVPQTFRAVIRMAAKTFDLYVDETRVACGAPFQNATFDAISRLAAAIPSGPPNPDPEALALDNVKIVRSATPNTPPELTPIGPKTVNEGELLQFTVSAIDCDGDPLTFSAVNVPLGAIFQDNGNNTGTFTWTPNSAQGGGQYYVTFEVDDGLATDSEEVTITVGDTVADADADGVPDAAHAVLGGPDNCQLVPNPGQFHVNDPTGTRGDACNNDNQPQTAITATTDQLLYEVGQQITATVSVTFNITGTECVLIRTVDPTSVHFEQLVSAAGLVTPDQVVHPGGPVVVSALQEVCPGSPATFSTQIVVNGPEAPHLFLPAGVNPYRATFSYKALDEHYPDVNPDGTCSVAPTPEDPDPCPPIFQVHTVDAVAQFTVIDFAAALAEADALCSFIQSTVLTDPNTKKDLLGKCRAIRDKIARRDRGSACNNCNTFIGAVQAYLSKNKISATDANLMLGRAARIKQLLGCP